MTMVTHGVPGRRITPAAAPIPQTPTQPIAAIGTVERQAAIENALQAALHYLRKPGDHAVHLHVATARAARAATLLKQACEDHAGLVAARANASGRV